MRLQLKLKVNRNKSGNILPLNYQYELSSAVYNIIEAADPDYSKWLHKSGYLTDNKRFKLFTFSRLHINDYTLDKENGRLIINSEHATWNIAFLPERSSANFIKGVFQDQIFSIGDRLSSIEFEICEIRIMPSLEYKEYMYFETLSPVCLTHRCENGKIKYLAPDDELYLHSLITGLKTRYKAINGKEFQTDFTPVFEPLGKIKSSLIKIKADRPEQTFVRGFSYKFKLSLPEELAHIAYESGFGEKGSLGFGMIQQINI